MTIIRVTIKDTILAKGENGLEYKEMMFPVEIPYSEENMAWAEENCVEGEPEVTDDGQPEPAPSGDDSAVWDELDAAYQEGVDSV